MRVFTFLSLLFTSSCLFAQGYTVSGPRTKMNLDVNGSHYTFYNLKTGNVIPLSDSATTHWHIGFNKTDVIVNSGVSGPGSVKAQLLDKHFINTVTMPTSGYITEADGNKAIPSGSGNGWYNYDQTTHEISAIPYRLIALQLPDGYALLEMVDYYKSSFGFNTGESGFVSFRYQYSSSTDVSQKYTRVENLLADGDDFQHFDFFNADSIGVNDLTKENWHIGFNATDIIVNSGTTGDGQTMAQMVEDTFDNLLYAPEDGYREDTEEENAIPSGSDNGWYHYDFLLTHTVKPLENTLLVADLGRKFVKVDFISYYKDAPANPILLNQSSYYTFNYYVNPRNTNDLNHLPAPLVGIETVVNELNLEVYPNPVTETVFVKNISAKAHTYELKNMLGQSLQTLEVAAGSQKQINLSALPSGMYIITNSVVTKTIIKK